MTNLKEEIAAATAEIARIEKPFDCKTSLGAGVNWTAMRNRSQEDFAAYVRLRQELRRLQSGLSVPA